jgi:hypothetical protein
MIRGIKGYSFIEALTRNKDLVKVLVAAVAGYNYFTGFNWTTFLGSVGIAFAALAGKLLVDFVDYFFSEVPEVY